MGKNGIKKRRAFSLAEIMIALVIVAILMAASAPLINRRASIDNSFKCYWVSSNDNNNNIYYSAGAVGIGTDNSNGYVLALQAQDGIASRIAFIGNNSVAGSIGIDGSSNIIIGDPGTSLSGSNNVLVGNTSTTTYPLNGNKLSIGGLTKAEPLLYGNFGSSETDTQKLKVNGKLYANTDIVDTTDSYSIYAKNGIKVISTGVNDTNYLSLEYDKITLGNTSIESDGITINGSEGNTTYGNDISGVGAITANGDITTADGNIEANIIDAGSYINIKQNSSTAYTGTGYEDDVIISRRISDGQLCLEINKRLNVMAVGIYVNGYVQAKTTVKAHTLDLLDDEQNNISTIGSNLVAKIKLIDGFGGTGTSDSRLKDILSDASYGIDEIRRLEIKKYRFKDEKKYGEGVRYGVIAQQIQEILPETVLKGKDGFLSIRSNDIFFIAINALKQLDKEIQNIKQMLELDDFKSDCSKLSSIKIIAQINKLKNENKELKNEINILKENNQNLEKRLENIEKQLQKNYK